MAQGAGPGGPLAGFAAYHGPRANHGMPWDAQADEEFRRRTSEGEMLPALVIALGRTQESVRTRANLLSIPVRSSTRKHRN